MATREELNQAKRKRIHLLRSILEKIDSLLLNTIQATNGEPINQPSEGVNG